MESESLVGNEGKTALVAGGGGFIGGHLVARLLEEGYERVRAVDIKSREGWYQIHERAESLVLDLKKEGACLQAVEGVDHVFNLACNMGGMGFIESNKSACMLNVLINTHLLEASRRAGVERFFFSSTACVYNENLQASVEVVPLKEPDAYPAQPEDGYGWEKLFSERMCRNYSEDYGLETRIARFHAIYGPQGTWNGGREKVPAAICRKVIQAKLSGDHRIEVWGDGSQRRSFLFIEDGLEGILRIFRSHYANPLNLGSDRVISINQLIDLVEGIAGITVERAYRLDAPQGVRGRSSDNSLIREELGWVPSIPLEVGIEKTYRWIFDQIST